MLRDSYDKINRSCKRSLVFHLGYDAGFFSEYNCMLYALCYCLTHGIQFKIYCADANFGYDRGWQDYFEPFFDEVADDFHHLNNYRYFDRPITSDFWIYLKRKIKSILLMDNSICRPYYKFEESTEIKKYKKKFHVDLLTQDVWNDFRDYPSNDVITNPFNGEKISEMRFLFEINSSIWKYNGVTKSAINKKIERINISGDYVGVHIRRGDKISEASNTPIEHYMDLLKEHTELKNVFVATDDCRTVEDLQNVYPDYRFYTLATKNELGYIQSEFEKNSGEEKCAQMISLFADVELLANAKYFIGTFSSNVGKYMAVRRNMENCYFVDYK